MELKILDLSHNLITVPSPIGSAPQSIYQPLQWLEELQYLDLSFNQINFSGMRTERSPLLPSLVDLNLDMNPITVLDHDTFAPLLYSNLSRLRLKDTNLTRIGRGAIYNSLVCHQIHIPCTWYTLAF